MSVTVKHLNADSSFLLLFSADPQPPPSSSSKSSNYVYSILIDPWLQGDSIVTVPWFAITKRVIPACIQHLSQIGEPDVVIVSQNKPDHCHEETLRQLRPESKTIIAAEPGAAKAIKSWNHFDPARILSLPKFRPDKKFSYATFYIPPLSPRGHRGVVTISFIPAKNYMTGLHNAIGITYLAPTHHKSVACISTVDLAKKTHYFHLPLSPTPSVHQQRPRTAGSNANRGSMLERPLTAGAQGYRPRLSQQGFSPISPTAPQSLSKLPHSPPSILSTDTHENSPTSTSPSTDSASSISSDLASLIDVAFQPKSSEFHPNNPRPLPTPPQSPSDSNFISNTPRSSTVSTIPSPLSTNPTNITPARPRPLSILYTPHGIPFTPDLQPYILHHLVSRGALPLTLLLHSFDRASNPWYLGGNIMSGALGGGCQIARGLMARVWISAHDEDKDDRGVGVRRLKVSRVEGGVEGVRRALWGEGERPSRGKSNDGDEMRRLGWCCDVRSLPAGGEMGIGQVRDLCVGMENKRESRLMRFGPLPVLDHSIGAEEEVGEGTASGIGWAS